MYERLIQREDLIRSLDSVSSGLNNLREVLNMIKETVNEVPLDIRKNNEVNKLVERTDGIMQEFTKFKDVIIKGTEIRVWYTD